MIDLHCHSTASDGTYAPGELVKSAAEKRITHLALTDHDTTAGIDEFLKAGKSFPQLNLIPGIELSVDFKGGELHLVGLFIDKDAPEMKTLTEEVKSYRRERNGKMLVKLSALTGKRVTAEDLLNDPSGQLGRPHMAKYLVKHGVVSSIQEAFADYLSDGGILNVPKKRVSIERALQTVHASGGVAILAHPSTLNLFDEELDALVSDYKEKGLDGLEAYSSHSPDEKRGTYAAIALKNSLIISGGSDFHGGNSRVASLGADLGGLKNEEILEPLYKKAAFRKEKAKEREG